MDKFENENTNGNLNKDNNNNEYKNYKCNCNENSTVLKWTCSDKIYDYDLCKKCKLNFNLNTKCVIRWQCPICNGFYCSNCFKLLVNNFCPLNHELLCREEMNHEGENTVVCDICARTITGVEDDFLDEVCDMIFCKNCVPTELIVDDLKC